MKALLLAIAMLLSAALASGQAELRPGVSSQSWDVFIEQSAEKPLETTVIFIDLLTGESVGIVTTGERYTLVGGAVLYFDRAERKVKLVKPDGVIRDHTFVMLDSGDYRIDWAVSDDGRRIAWANSRKNDDDLLTTTLKVADAAGAEIRELLVYGPRPGIRLVPLAFGGDSETIYLEAQADATRDAGAYTRRSGLFALDFGGKTVAASALPAEGTCYCAVGFGDDLMLRLVPAGDSAGFELEIHALGTGELRRAMPVSLGDYNEAGNLLVSPDGALAVYALSQVSGYATDRAEVRSVIVLADLENARQMLVNYSMSAPVQPISFTEDNSALLLTQAGIGGVWKMKLDDGATVKVADGVHLGRIGDNAEP